MISFDRKLFDLAKEGRPGDAQLGGRLFVVPVGGCQLGQDRLLFLVLARLGKGGRRRRAGIVGAEAVVGQVELDLFPEDRVAARRERPSSRPGCAARGRCPARRTSISASRAPMLSLSVGRLLSAHSLARK